MSRVNTKKNSIFPTIAKVFAIICFVVGVGGGCAQEIKKSHDKFNVNISKIKIVQKKYKSPIYSLQAQSEVSGNMSGFVLGFLPMTYGDSDGQVKSSISYYVYLKHGKGYILKNYSSDTTTLIETNSEKPGLLETYKIIYMPDSLDNYFDLPDKYKNMFSFDKFDSSNVKDGVREIWLLQSQDLIVPVNTIKKQFDATIQK